MGDCDAAGEAFEVAAARVNSSSIRQYFSLSVAEALKYRPTDTLSFER
jgi:hypothetical protein